MANDHTIDITDLVEQTRSAFVDWGVAFLMAEEVVAIPALAPWLAVPFIAEVDRELLKLVLEALSHGLVMQAFFLNTAIRKAAQAVDFAEACEALNNLPPGTSDADYLAAEKARMVAFAGFVSITN